MCVCPACGCVLACASDTLLLLARSHAHTFLHRNQSVTHTLIQSILRLLTFNLIVSNLALLRPSASSTSTVLLESRFRIACTASSSTSPLLTTQPATSSVHPNAFRQLAHSTPTPLFAIAESSTRLPCERGQSITLTQDRSTPHIASPLCLYAALYLTPRAFLRSTRCLPLLLHPTS